MNESSLKQIFNIEPRFNPSNEEIDKILERISTVVFDKLGRRVARYDRLGIGQNVNFRIYVEDSKLPQYLLRIISMKGYPSMDSLRHCYRLLDNTNIIYSKLCISDSSNDIVPYGFFIQNWVEGIDALEKYGENNTETYFKWVDDFIEIVKKAHEIKFPYYGYIDDGPKYPTFVEYFKNMDKVIDNSFGNVFKGNYSIWDIEKHGLTSQGFLKQTFERVYEMSQSIKSPVRSVLIHGDMLPQNLIYTKTGCALIDWDECRANWWVYEIARTSFFIESKELIYHFVNNYGDTSAAIEDIDIGIRLEHTRQLLRRMFISAFFMRDIDELKARVREFEGLIDQKLSKKIV